MSFNDLTKREQVVVQCLLEGKSNKEIAEFLYISQSRTNAIISDLYNKYEITTPPKRAKLILTRLKEIRQLNKP